MLKKNKEQLMMAVGVGVLLILVVIVGMSIRSYIAKKSMKSVPPVKPLSLTMDEAYTVVGYDRSGYVNNCIHSKDCADEKCAKSCEVDWVHYTGLPDEDRYKIMCNDGCNAHCKAKYGCDKSMCNSNCDAEWDSYNQQSSDYY